MILDYIINFLSFDLLSFFDPQSKYNLRNLFAPTRVIEPKYIQRPTIINERYVPQNPPDVFQEDEEMYTDGEEVEHDDNDNNDNGRMDEEDVSMDDQDVNAQEEEQVVDENDGLDEEDASLEDEYVEHNEKSEEDQSENNQQKDNEEDKKDEEIKQLSKIIKKEKEDNKKDEKEPQECTSEDEMSIDLTDEDDEMTEVSCAEENTSDEAIFEAPQDRNVKIDRDDYKEMEVAKAERCCLCCDSNNHPVCNDVCMRVLATIVEKCANASYCELESVEEKAENLWNLLTEDMVRSSRRAYSEWWGLKSWQKLPFYWAALANEVLDGNPYENFRRFYVNYKKDKYHSRRSERVKSREAAALWIQLTITQRLPFIMEAFISKIGTGKVNIDDEWEMQKVMAELQKKL